MKPRFTLFAPEGDNGGGGGSTLLDSLSGGGGQQQQSSSQQGQQSSEDSPAAAFDFRTALDDKGNFKPGWNSSLPDDLKDYADHLGKFPTPVELLRSHANAQKLIGQKATLKVPGEGAKPEEVTAFRKAIGVPDSPEGYNLKVPENLPEGVTATEKELGEFAKFAHEQNLTPAQVNKLIEYDLAQKAQMAKSGHANLTAFVEGQKTALQTKWGDKINENAAVAWKAAALLGIDSKDPELANSAKFIEAMYNASKMFSEDKLLGADKAGTGLTGTQQAEDIRRNPNNPWHNAYHGKEGDERQREAAALMARLSGVKAG